MNNDLRQFFLLHLGYLKLHQKSCDSKFSHSLLRVVYVSSLTQAESQDEGIPREIF